MGKTKDTRLCAESLYGAHTKTGLVQLSQENSTWKIQCSPEEARAYARIIFEAAEAAEVDEIFVKFFSERLNLSLDQTVMILQDFRQLREVVMLNRAAQL